MSKQLAALLGTPNTTLLPGRTLNRLRLKATTEAEQHVQGWFVLTATFGLPADQVASARSAAAVDAIWSFRWGSPHFKAAMHSTRGEILTLMLSLAYGPAGRDDKITWEAVEAIHEANVEKMNDVVDWYWGWESPAPEKKTDAGVVQSNPTTPNSLSITENATPASPTTTLAT